MVAPSMTRASNAPDDILIVLSFLVCDWIRACPMIVELTDCSPAWPFPYSMQMFAMPHGNSAPKSSKNRTDPREEISVVAVADVAVEPNVDLPRPALRLHEIGQHGVRALGYGLDVSAQHLHEVGDLLAQGALVNGRHLAIGDDNPTVDDYRLHSGAGLREHDLAGNAVEWDERRIGEIDDRQIGGHAWPQSADLSLQSRCARAAHRRRPDRIGSGGGTEFRLRYRGKARE